MMIFQREVALSRQVKETNFPLPSPPINNTLEMDCHIVAIFARNINATVVIRQKIICDCHN